VALATETEKQAERFARDRLRLGDEGRYFRFSVLRRLEDIGLGEYMQKNAIVAATNRYIQSQDVHRQRKACGTNLAERECMSLGSRTMVLIDGDTAPGSGLTAATATAAAAVGNITTNDPSLAGIKSEGSILSFGTAPAVEAEGPSSCRPLHQRKLHSLCQTSLKC
jgi:hypothetical protein